MAVVDHGASVVNARQRSVALSPNAAGDGWNLIANLSGGGSSPQEWPVVKNFTTTPALSTFFTPNHHYSNTNYGYLNLNQPRAANGRIFFLLEDMYLAYYDMLTEQVVLMDQLVETPPISTTVATIPFSITFDVWGVPWIASQESQHRPSCLSYVDTTTTPPTWNIASYVGSNMNAYSVFGFYTAPDTGTAIKTVYNAVGEDPWQVWYTDVTPGPTFGTAGMMKFPDGSDAQVPSTGNISFQFIAGQGVACTIHTNLGQPDDQVTTWWLIDRVMVPKTNNISPNPREVTPASNPLVNPPDIDLSGGAGLLRWRPHGSSSDYTDVPYNVTYALPVTIESLAPSNNGIVGNAQQYLGFFRQDEPGDVHSYFGAWPSGVSEPVELYVNGILYVAGYPNSVFYSLDPTKGWAASASTPNPKNLGNFGLNGTQAAGTKYSRRLAWAAGAGTQGRVFQAGDRERNGSGCGLGSWDKQAGTFAGIYSSADGSTGPASMSAALTSGLLVDSVDGQVAMATKLITPPGSALLYVFDYSFALVGSAAPVAGLSNLGQIFATSTPHVVCGVTQSANGKLALYQYNLHTFSLVTYVETSIAGTPAPMSQHPVTGMVWAFIGNMLYVIDVDTLKVSPLQDVTAQAPIGNSSTFAADQKTFWFNGGAPSGVSGAELYSLSLFPAYSNPYGRMGSTTSQRHIARGRVYTP